MRDHDLPFRCVNGQCRYGSIVELDPIYFIYLGPGLNPMEPAGPEFPSNSSTKKTLEYHYFMLLIAWAEPEISGWQLQVVSSCIACSNKHHFCISLWLNLTHLVRAYKHYFCGSLWIYLIHIIRVNGSLGMDPTVPKPDFSWFHRFSRLGCVTRLLEIHWHPHLHFLYQSFFFLYIYYQAIPLWVIFSFNLKRLGCCLMLFYDLW